jgi:hypothetical protein
VTRGDGDMPGWPGARRVNICTTTGTENRTQEWIEEGGPQLLAEEGSLALFWEDGMVRVQKY